MPVTPTATSTTEAAVIHFKASSGEGFLLYGILIIALLVVLIPIILRRGDRNFFRIPYITWFLLHYSIAALGILAIVMLGLTGIINAEVISALLGSLLGYILGSSSRSSTTQNRDDNDAAKTLSISTDATLPAGSTTAAYNQTLSASGGATPYQWAVTKGTPPSGLSLDQATGALTGAPTTAGTSTFTVTVSDSGEATAKKEFKLTVS